jgi:hypothetical protein
LPPRVKAFKGYTFVWLFVVDVANFLAFYYAGECRVFAGVQSIVQRS